MASETQRKRKVSSTQPQEKKLKSSSKSLAPQPFENMMNNSLLPSNDTSNSSKTPYNQRISNVVVFPVAPENRQVTQEQGFVSSHKAPPLTAKIEVPRNSGVVAAQYPYKTPIVESATPRSMVPYSPAVVPRLVLPPMSTQFLGSLSKMPSPSQTRPPLQASGSRAQVPSIGTGFIPPSPLRPPEAIDFLQYADDAKKAEVTANFKRYHTWVQNIARDAQQVSLENQYLRSALHQLRENLRENSPYQSSYQDLRMSANYVPFNSATEIVPEMVLGPLAPLGPLATLVFLPATNNGRNRSTNSPTLIFKYRDAYLCPGCHTKFQHRYELKYHISRFPSHTGGISKQGLCFQNERGIFPLFDIDE